MRARVPTGSASFRAIIIGFTKGSNGIVQDSQGSICDFPIQTGSLEDGAQSDHGLGAR